MRQQGAHRRSLRPAARRIAGAGLVALLAAVSAAGCTSFGGAKTEAPVDPNVFPTNYRRQIVDLMATMLSDRADYRGALISEPALRPIAQVPHYVVCLQFNGHDHKSKAVIFLSGTPTQFIDATPELCVGAAYQPFKELEQAIPER